MQRTPSISLNMHNQQQQRQQKKLPCKVASTTLLTLQIKQQLSQSATAIGAQRMNENIPACMVR
jgi:hypothetical protein